MARLLTTWNESIQVKKNKINTVRGVKITFILFKCHRSIDSSIDFYHFIVLWKGSWQQRIQSWKFKISSWITNHDPLSQTLEFVRNGRGLLGLETSKSSVSQELIDKINRFLTCWYKFKKAKSFGKNLVPEIWVKMHLANQITGLLSQLYL